MGITYPQGYTPLDLSRFDLTGPPTAEDFGVVAGRRRVTWPEPNDLFTQELGYHPYRQQQEFHDDRSRIKTVAGAKRIGKSLMGARELEPIILTPGTHIWIVGVTYRRGVKEFEYIYNDLLRTMKLGTVEANFNIRGGYMNIRFPWDSMVEVRSAKDENDLESEALDAVLMAEPAQHRESAFELLRERVSEKRGVMILPGTPPLSRHWLKKIYDRGFDPSWEDYASFHIPATETPYPGLDEVEKLRRELSPLRFRRDVLAEFVATDEIVYSDFEYPVHVADVKYDPNLPLYWAMDFGYKAPWVCLWVQVDPSQDRIYILREYYRRRRSDSENIETVKAIHAEAEYKRTEGNSGDPHGAASRAELARHEVFFTGMGGSQKGDGDRGRELVRQWLAVREDGRPGVIVDRSCENTIDEFSLYHYLEGSQEKVAKEDDHAMDAFRYFMLDHYGSPEPGIYVV